MGVTVLANKKVRHTFASEVASLSRELSEYTEDVEDEWDLFKSAVITPAAANCGCKRVEGQMGSEKKLLGGTKKLKKLFVQRKLPLELG